MKTTITLFKLFSLSFILLWGCSGISQESSSDETTYFAVEINGIICGYSESVQSTTVKDNRTVLSVMDDITLKLTILGQDMDISILNQYEIDSSSGNYLACRHRIKTGVTTMVSITKVEGDKILFSTAEDQEPEEFILTPELILETSISYPHLMRDFVLGGEKEKEYQVFDDMQGKVVSKMYTRLDDEELSLAGKTFQTVVFEELNLTTGIKSQMWLINDEGFPVKFYVAGRTIYLADASVKKKINMADMDNVLFARVNKVIPGIQDLTYMKVRAQVQSGGEWLTVESLNFPGQQFTGTVTDNLIDGIFEIEPMRYAGMEAPGFPFDYPLSEELEKYVQPQKLIESDHPDLIAKSQEVTAGASNSWDAAVRLSKWVGENIHGAIPGGTSAINTFNTREGECGSHSRLLAAFCRASGIPARLSIGCMYSTYLGGSFGQHAWTEVYMGDAGWIAIDASANEFDYVDAGHIRLGEETSFNPKGMEILEYRVGESNNVVKDQIPQEYMDYLGEYRLPGKDKTFRVFYQDGSLAVDIPDKMVLALDDADENGLYYPSITRQVNFQFIRDTMGKVEDMRLQQLIPIPKKEMNDSIVLEDHAHALVGKYSLPQANIEMSIFAGEKGLVIVDPITDKEAEIEQDETTGLWTIHSTNNQLEFEEDENGKVRKLIYYENLFLRKENTDEVQIPSI